MTAYVKYGTYAHDAGEVEVSISEEILETDAATPYARMVRWDLVGMLIGSSAQDIDTKAAALKAAYAENGKDLSLMIVNDAGNTVKADCSITSTDATGGVRVIRPPSFPAMRNAAYVTYLPYTITLEAEIPVADAPTLLRSFEERLTFSGGGPRYGMLEPNRGAPIRQRLKEQTIWRAEQTGRAVGLYSRPSAPLPLWPAWLVERGTFGKTGARRRGSGASLSYTDFDISWAYSFESPIQLIGNPRSWGAT